MKKLLLSGITAVALMAAGTAQAGGLELTGGTGVARTPLAMSLAPMQFAIAADYLSSDELFVPVRAAIGLPFGIELGGAYWYTSLAMLDEGQIRRKIPSMIREVGAPEVRRRSRPGRGRPLLYGIKDDDFGYKAKNNGFDVYSVATYIIRWATG